MARRLLGSRLAWATAEGPRWARLVETEAYLAEDPASHSFRGPTARNRSMFGPPGRWYVYRIHQVHCLNVVTRRGEAVLLRAAESTELGARELSGPGRLARAMGIDREADGRPVGTGPWRLLPGPRPREPILVGPRIGVSKARTAPLRFALAGVAAVSRPRPSGGSSVP